MARKVYRSQEAVLKAAQKKLGGRQATYDGTPVLHLVKRGLSGQLVDIYLSDMEAAEQAGLDYRPRGREYEW